MNALIRSDLGLIRSSSAPGDRLSDRRLPPCGSVPAILRALSFGGDGPSEGPEHQHVAGQPAVPDQPAGRSW